MIELLRVDDRLIHGQVAVTWTSHLGADTILVANDKAKDDPLMRSAFKLAKPPQCLLSIKSVAGAVLVINNPKHEARRIFVVCASPEDALRIVRECPEAKSVCLGGIRQSGERKQVAPQVYLDSEDLKAVKEIDSLGRNVYLQSLPEQKAMTLGDIERALS
ncbi:PTS sugar transporter subunit IIB [uncultured Parolsenella sp.]|uniref:PTS system mannose/fructose/N-acetylgalactosamine-transporter subunit IIB n=1 Tax=uncultured Parolsenella sp. TaxID=2083008 RepID=UPI0027D991A0|nr:PTS sugar transporter subunit IIB [uncultured Parolsenella sp.]